MTNVHYRRQRSCGKVIFSQASVILSTGEVSAWVHAGIHHPRADTSPEADTPLGRHSPSGRHPLGRHHPPEQTPPQQMATAEDGAHPTGMHSCCESKSLWEKNIAVDALADPRRRESNVFHFHSVFGKNLPKY